MSRTKGSANKQFGKVTKVKDAQIQFRCTADQRYIINRIAEQTQQSVAEMILNAVHNYGLINYKMIQSGITPQEINKYFG